MKKTFWLIILVVCCFKGFAQADFKVMFYNVENLFDTQNDTLKNDEEFLPDGKRHWTFKKYHHKLHQISKVIAAAGKWGTVDVIGLAEVENRKVLRDLISKTGLKQVDYGIVHKESPDKRGIDVALLYCKTTFNPISYKHIPVVYSNKKHRATRDILYVCGTTLTGDTLHFFVNHWPSRWGGQLKTEPKRVLAAQILKRKIDSLSTVLHQPKIIVMGDLNDTPSDKSVREGLQAVPPSKSSVSTNKLVDLLWPLEKKHKGTHYYKGKWSVLDHFIVSSYLLDFDKTTYIKPTSAYPLYLDFLLKKDNKYLSFRPKRTYRGYRYEGGFSDHLPIILDLYFKKVK